MALIEVKNLEKVYGEEGVETPALRGLNFNVEKAEFVAVMGPSGCGKSTLLHVLGFLDRHSRGTYLFDGKSMDEYSDDELARVRNKKMGFIFQMFNLLPRTTVLENVKLPLAYSDVKESLWDDFARKAIAEVGLEHRADHETTKLSGGEKQRVAIARALVNNPQIVFADEPTGNLDSKSGGQIMELIEGLHEKGCTIILVTHETYTAGYAERIINLKDGLIESDLQVAARHHRGDKFIK